MSHDDEYGRVMLGQSKYTGSQPLLANQRIRLLDLEPRWFVSGDKGNLGASERHGMGLSFLCPIHKTHRIAVAFANPIDNGPPAPDHKFLWNRQGDTFETLTLGPSVDASNHSSNGVDMIQSPCWHGHIRNGYCE